ncbi:MAG: hypothetical protein JNL58_08525 [Planctomyces sp.]|nr:hypothetical protein [Planctomyces sp.]
MKGPTFQFDQRVLRVWVCPNCNRSVRTPGAVTSRTCGCAEPPLQMKLVDQRVPHTFDVASFISPDSPEYDDDESPDGLDEPTAAIMAALLARAEAARPPRETPTAEHFGVTGDEDGLSEFGEGVEESSGEVGRTASDGAESLPEGSRPSDRRPRSDRYDKIRADRNRNDRGQRTRPGRNEPTRRPDASNPRSTDARSSRTSTDDSRSSQGQQRSRSGSSFPTDEPVLDASAMIVSEDSASTDTETSGESGSGSGTEGGERRRSRSRRRRRSGRKPGENGSSQNQHFETDRGEIAATSEFSGTGFSDTEFNGESGGGSDGESGADDSVDGGSESAGDGRPCGPRKRRNRRRGRRRGGAGTERQQGESGPSGGPQTE